MFLALGIFVALLIAGVMMKELGWLGVAGFVALAAGSAAMFASMGWGQGFYTAVLSALDVALVLVIFKGDLRTR